jgi:CRISPR-associated endonuclease/helicase Cas3
MTFYAHTKENEPESKWQLLSKHLKQTAEIAESFATDEEEGQYFRMAGLMHDFGKYQQEFQEYLKNGGKRGSVPHASWGAALAKKMNLREISLAVNGHHKGLIDTADWQVDMKKYSVEMGNHPEHYKTFLNDLHLSEEDLKKVSPKFSDKDEQGYSFERELFVRYLFSALADADWLDTEAHFHPEVGEKRGKKELEADIMISLLEAHLLEKSKAGELNQLRNLVRDYSISKASLPVGFYSMNLPTGLGKTLTSLSWALHHAKVNGLKRIIIVLPFINIIDQTAQILKGIFGDNLVLEHHSNYNEGINTGEDTQEIEYSKRLACENWDYPVIVTTTIQFFESLFSNKPSRCRKIHNIAKSVVIFDEVQSLPKEMIQPTLTMLKNVQKMMKTSFLFCTATLPAFEKRERFDGIENIQPLVENPGILFQKTRRVNYQIIRGFDEILLEELSMETKNKGSCLCVFNTKKSSRLFFDLFKNREDFEKHYHLSTGMCPDHRKKAIQSIRDDLNRGRKIFVSSTQLIEAGVDFDFPCVFREIAPLESIIQSAGRCNREGKMPERGQVYLFRLKDGGMPDKLYKTIADFVVEIIKDNIDRLYEHNFFDEYYRKVVSLFVDTDKKNINPARKELNFETVANSYRLIEKTTEALFVFNYSEESRQIAEKLQMKEYMSRDDWKKLQPYMVNVYPDFLFKNKGLHQETKHGFKIWYGNYDRETGISVEPMAVDELIV